MKISISTAQTAANACAFYCCLIPCDTYILISNLLYQNGDLHTVRGNELAMTAAHRLLDGDWAKEIMTVPANSDSKKGLNPATLMIAVRVLVETERAEEARQILKVCSPWT